MTRGANQRATIAARGHAEAAGVGPSACWVGMHEGRVAASDRSLGRLIARLKKSGIAVEEATFRFVNDGAKAA